MKTVMKAVVVLAAMVAVFCGLEELGKGKLEVNQAQADERIIANVRSPDAGASTSTFCVGLGPGGLYGQNTSIDVLCSARFCYITSGDQKSTNTTVPQLQLTACQNLWLYDGGVSTTVFGEGIRPNPPARIQIREKPCITFISPDNALDAGTITCDIWQAIGSNGGADPRP